MTKDDMTADGLDSERSMEADLIAWGRVISLETRGRRSGQPRRVSVGFIEEGAGNLLVAAGSETTHWAQNLIADESCRVELAGVHSERRAERLEGEEHQAAVRELILKYGTPAENLGAGPAFRLTPMERDQ
jgi:deazaflavin-dependent oxidoreductase (nitroreductase family)